MRRGVVTLVVLLAVAPGAHAGPPPGEPVAPLTPAGRFFHDARGRVVPVRGLFGKWKQRGDVPRSDAGDGPADTGNANSTFGLRDATMVAGLGSTALRLSWFWEALQPKAPPAPASADYLDRLAEVQRDLGRVGVFSLVDLHQDLYGRRYQSAPGGPSKAIDSPGAPDWATLDDGVPQPASFGFPANYLLPATSHAFDNLWLNRDGILDRLADAWKLVAHRFAGEPYVLGYDLFNEPWPGTEYPSCAQPAGCPGFDVGVLQPALERLAQAVHAEDPSRVALFEPHLLFNMGVASHLGATYAAAGLPAGVAPAGASFHDQCITRALLPALADYAPELTDPAAQQAKPGCSVSDGLVMDRGQALGDTFGGPAIMTELQPTSSEDVPGIECMIEKAESRMLGYTYGLSWSPRASGSTELRDMFEPPHPGEARADEVVRARAKAYVLARTAPEAIAGDPQSWGFDPRTGAFALRFAPRTSASGPTSVFVPGRQYPEGFTIAAHDGLAAPERTPVPGGTLLSFTTLPGAAAATIRVERVGAAPADLPALPAC